MRDKAITIKLLVCMYRLRYPCAFTEDPQKVRQAAQNGDPAAQTQLAFLLLEDNCTEAAQWLQRAADQLYLPALLSLCDFYLEGIGVRKNYKKAYKLSLQCERQDPIQGEFALANLYLIGCGVKQDHVKAMELLSHVYRVTNPESLTDSDETFLPDDETGSSGALVANPETSTVPQIVDASARAIVFLHAFTKNCMGYCFLQGRGIEHDYQKAAEFFSYAAQFGIPTAKYNLGFCYYTGCGIEQNRTKSMELFKEAGDQGVWQGSLAYARMLLIRWRFFKAIPYLWNSGSYGKYIIYFWISLLGAFLFGLGVYFKLIPWYREINF